MKPIAGAKGEVTEGSFRVPAINFRMNSLQSMKFSLWKVPTTPRLKIDQKPSIVLV